MRQRTVSELISRVRAWLGNYLDIEPVLPGGRRQRPGTGSTGRSPPTVHLAILAWRRGRYDGGEGEKVFGFAFVAAVEASAAGQPGRPRLSGREPVARQSDLRSGGALLASFGPIALPARHTLLSRDVVTSGTTLGSVVIKSFSTFGAKMQARFASEHGKLVFLIKSPAHTQP